MPLVAIPRVASVGLQTEKERGEDPGKRGYDRLSVEWEMKEIGWSWGQVVKATFTFPGNGPMCGNT